MSGSRGWNHREAVEYQQRTPDLAKQEFKDDCDINKIMDRWLKKGQLPDLPSRLPEYGDYSNPLEYREAIHLVRDAETAFQALPAKVKHRMGNSPIALMGFMQNPDNLDEQIALGLVEKPKGYKTPEEREARSVPTETTEAPESPVQGGE